MFVSSVQKQNSPAFGLNLNIAPEVKALVKTNRDKNYLTRITERASQHTSTQTLDVAIINGKIAGILKDGEKVLIQGIPSGASISKNTAPLAKAAARINDIVGSAYVFIKGNRTKGHA